jgi:hypothetical protein
MAWATATGLDRITIESAGTGISTGYQGKLGWKDNGLTGPCNADIAILQGLAQEL